MQRRGRGNHSVSGVKRKRIKKNEDGSWSLWNTIMWTDIHVIDIPEREERKKGAIFKEIVDTGSQEISK